MKVMVYYKNKDKIEIEMVEKDFLDLAIEDLRLNGNLILDIVE